MRATFLPVPSKRLDPASVMNSACRGETNSPGLVCARGISRVPCSREQLLSDYDVRALMLCGCNGSLPVAPDSNKLYIKQTLSGERYDRVLRAPGQGEREFDFVTGLVRNRIGFQTSGELS